MEKEHPLLNVVSGFVLATVVIPVCVFILLQIFGSDTANNLIAASTFGLFVAAFMSMLIGFNDFLRKTKPKD
ncbi:hypothetical protein ACVHVJ_001102 [Salmonella enterica subsp. enterica serovar Newport]